MLGWEFPPLFSGGLGVATYGLVKSLNPLSHIRLIIPTAGTTNDLNGINVIGLNQVSAEEINLEKLDFSLQFQHTEVHRLPLLLSPYHYTNQAHSQHEFVHTHFSKDTLGKLKAVHSIFSGNEIYGFNILHKVQLFAQLAEDLAADGDFDVIHAHDWVTYPAAIQIKKSSGKPLVVHVHALETDRAGEDTRNSIYWMERTGLETADRIIAVSAYTKEQITKLYQIDASKITVVHNGIEPAPRERKGHQLKDKLVLFLGRITHQKGPEFLLETAEKVSRVYPRVKFVVAGMGNQFAHLLETSAYKKLGSKFIFAGFLSKSKVNELLSMADVYFMPSISEPFGLSALEAAQHAVPSVISIQSGAAEVMKASLQANFWDTDKYANYIHALLRYEALGKELSAKALVELDQLTWDHAAKKIMNVYQSL